MIDPGLIVFGVQALVRLGREGKASIEQLERDRDLLFPQPLLVDFTNFDLVVRVFANNDANSALVDKARNGPLARFWDAENERPDPRVPGSAEVLFLEAVRIRTEQAAKNGKILPLRGAQVAGAIIVKQWADGTAPVGPLGRMVLAVADIGLEFVGTRASVLGIGGNAEKLLAAVALNLADLIPDDGAQLGPRSQLSERLLGVFLRAGLSAIADQPDLVIGAQHLRELVTRTLPPIVKALPQDLAAQAAWENVADALLGPAASAAMQTIAANPVAFLGARFDSEKAIGALTGALLREASARTLQDNFSEAGFLALYRAALGVAATRPQLFIGGAATDDQLGKLASELIGGIADTLRTAPVPFNGDLGAQLAGSALQTLAQNAGAFLDPSRPWQATAAALAQQVAVGLQTALANGHIVFSPDQLLALGSTFFTQVARNPAMIAGGSTELQGLVEAVAQALAKDPGELLHPDDWLEIAAVVAQEVAANPGRLLKLLPADAAAPAMALCTALIGDLLAVAAAERTAGGRAAGGVLSGATLRDAIIVLLRVASGNADAAVANRAAVSALAARIAELVRAKAGRYGSKEWLFLYRALIGRVLASGELLQITDELAGTILEGGKA
jgi:hypothetical protein